MRIAIDLDKTLVDCGNSLIYTIANKYFGDKDSNKKLKYHVLPKNANTKNSFISKILRPFLKMGRHTSYSLIDNAASVVNSWYNAGVKIYILSSRPNILVLNNAITNFLRGANLHYDNLIVGCNNKSKFCQIHKIELLVDNSLTKCINAKRSGFDSICLKNFTASEYNSVKIASNWNDINAYVKTLLKKEKNRQILEQEKFKYFS